jgi:hypothetical protein
MPVDAEKVKDILDKFTDDDFVGAKEDLKNELRKARNEFLKDKLSLEKELDPDEDVDPDDNLDTE